MGGHQTAPGRTGEGWTSAQLLIEAEALAARLGALDLALVDLRFAEKYRVGHLPGAVSLNLAQTNRAGVGQRLWPSHRTLG